MPPKCIVSDLDRTLTGADLKLDPGVVERIAQLRARGIRVVLATGRRFDEIVEMGLVARLDAVVAENGAVLCVPGAAALETREPGFAAAARAALGPLAERFVWGRVLGSGPREVAAAASAKLQAADVAHAMEYNAEEVMLLPAGVNKATGAAWCLRHFELDAADAWAIGDGENDASMLRWARVGIAPGNAAPAAKAAADVHVAAGYSRAFLEVTAPLLADDGPAQEVAVRAPDVSAAEPRVPGAG